MLAFHLKTPYKMEFSRTGLHPQERLYDNIVI